MSEGAPLLAVHGLELAYGVGPDAFRLSVPSLELRAQQALAVLGPNGAGKTTLLRAMAGLLEPRAGQVVRGADRDVALVFQRPLVFRGSVAYNVELPLWARGLSGSQRSERAHASLQAFGIEHLARRNATTLSGGELRRLALARAFVTRPDVLLLDEPFDDLDAAGRESLSLDLRRVVDEQGVAVAMVTHDLRQALLLADRIAVLLGGRMAQLGSRDEILREPADPAVAGVVGMTNVLPGVVRSGGAAGLTRVRLEGGPEIACTARAALEAPVWVGVRPENVKLQAAHGDEETRLGRAVVTRILSDGILANALLDWDGVELRTHLVAGRGLGHTLKRGDPVRLSIRPEDVHLMPRSEVG
ncbi:MAG: ABC transporter ATP-binding protein [Deltaproteobacteria bacterium]|nr:ABC transporter ATP-binding protein [Deltaproteobacteria bacterium]MBW2372556.1 ABC transporter ATP-binding protein [Deltaproteobacteria bacterium]